ncbi:hypothetical protein HDU92_005748 [Lobulomyces angularis]|nr:hypothetical protein HDU92_005748 [Lobulomyces angularis]
MEGKAFRHGDIADVLLELSKTAAGASLLSFFKSDKFKKLDIQRIYFGNWLRDFSQAMDVGALSKVSRDQILTLLVVFSFLSNGYGTKEFQVTEERLGTYRPEEHIDNPKGYPTDAQKYHPGLRAPVRDIELQIDLRTGMKNYIANESGDWTTSAGFVRYSVLRCLDFGRRYLQTGNATDEYEAFRLLGQLLHTLEDFPAHSNFIELSLIKLGHRNVFPHVGSQCFIKDPFGNQVYPLVTGTFGSSDFLHSLLGEAQDKISEASINDLTKEIDSSTQNDGSTREVLSLLGQVPGFDSNQISRDMNDINTQCQSRRDRGSTSNSSGFNAQESLGSIWKVLEFRDDLLKSVSSFIEKIPGLSWLSEKISEALTVYVLSTSNNTYFCYKFKYNFFFFCCKNQVEPIIKPVVSQVMGGLQSTSAKVLDNPEQFAVFTSPHSSDPTHSFLSKDHFNLILNEPAGNLAKIILKHTVGLIVNAWADPSSNPQNVANQILEVFFHPNFCNSQSVIQNEMNAYVSQWANSVGHDILLRLSKDSIKAGTNTRSGKAASHSCNDGSPNIQSFFGGKKRGLDTTRGFSTSPNNQTNPNSNYASQPHVSNQFSGSDVHQPVNDLPPGWITQFDPNSNRNFYVDTATGTSHWVLPQMNQTAQQFQPVQSQVQIQQQSFQPQVHVQQQSFPSMQVQQPSFTPQVQVQQQSFQSPVQVLQQPLHPQGQYPYHSQHEHQTNQSSSQYYQPAVQAASIQAAGNFAPNNLLSSYEVQSQTNELIKAMKGFGTNESVLISIFTKNSPQQLRQIADNYQSLKGKSLTEKIRSETSGDFSFLLEQILKCEPISVDQDYHKIAASFHSAMSGIGSNNEKLSILFVKNLNPGRLRCIKDAYQSLYHKSLLAAIDDEMMIRGVYKSMLVKLCNL